MDMQVMEREDGVSHVVLGGRLDATSVDEIEAEFSAATGQQDRSAIIDMSGIEFMASRGIGLLFAQAKKLKKAKHTLVIFKPEGMVETVLKISKMDMVMPIAHDWHEALVLALGEEGAAAAEAAAVDTAEPEDTAATKSASAVDVGEEFSLKIKNELSELDGLNAKLHEFLDAHKVPERASYAIDLAIEELVVNVINYAYVDDDEHLIDFHLAIEENGLDLKIQDDGRPFDPRGGPALNEHVEDREVGGLGLILVLDLVDMLRYERVDDKNCVEVRVHFDE